MRFAPFNILVLIFGLLLVSCSKTVYKGMWQSPPIKADEIPAEWGGPLQMHDNASDIYFGLSNDSVNFYVRAKTKNKQTQMQIFRYGLQLWIDTSGRNRAVTGLQFPFTPRTKKSQNPDEGADSLGSYNRVGREQRPKRPKEPDLEALRNKFNASEKWINLTGFKPPVSGIVSVFNDFGIQANIGWDTSNTLYYEACIPFKTFFRNALKSSDSLIRFGIQITTKALPVQAYPGEVGYGPGMGGGMSGFGMGMGGIGGVGMGMGMAGMGFGLRVPLGGGGGYPGNYGNYNGNNGTSIKLKIKLAVKPDIQSVR